MIEAAQRSQDAQTRYVCDYCCKSSPIGVNEVKECMKGHKALNETINQSHIGYVVKRRMLKFLSDAYGKAIVRGLETMATKENTLTDGLEALRLTTGAEGSAKSAVANLANDAMKNESAMASRAKKDTMTGLRIMQIVCSDTFKASACLTKASALVKDVGDEKVQLWKKNKICTKVRLFFNGIDQEVTTDALQHAFLKFGQVMWLNQDDIDDQLKIDVAHKRRKVMQRNSIGDLTSTCSFLRELRDLLPADDPTPNSERFALSAIRCYDRSQHVASYGLREMANVS